MGRNAQSRGKSISYSHAMLFRGDGCPLSGFRSNGNQQGVDRFRRHLLEEVLSTSDSICNSIAPLTGNMFSIEAVR